MSQLSIYGSLSPVHYNNVHIMANNTHIINYYPNNSENVYFYYEYNNDKIIIINAYVYDGFLVIIDTDLNYVTNEMTKINQKNYTVYCSNPHINIIFDYRVCDGDIIIYLKFKI